MNVMEIVMKATFGTVDDPPLYCSKTVSEDTIPELVRGLFWVDEFRLQWDDIILSATTIDECHTTWTMAMHWIFEASQVLFWKIPQARTHITFTL